MEEKILKEMMVRFFDAELTAEDLKHPVQIVNAETTDSPESEFAITPQAMANRINFAADNAFTTATKEDGTVWLNLNDDMGNSIVITPCTDHPAYTASVMFIGNPDQDFMDDAADCIGAAILGTDALETSDVFTHSDLNTTIQYENNQETGFTVLPK